VIRKDGWPEIEKLVSVCVWAFLVEVSVQSRSRSGISVMGILSGAFRFLVGWVLFETSSLNMSRPEKFIALQYVCLLLPSILPRRNYSDLSDLADLWEEGLSDLLEDGLPPPSASLRRLSSLALREKPVRLKGTGSFLGFFLLAGGLRRSLSSTCMPVSLR